MITTFLCFVKPEWRRTVPSTLRPRVKTSIASLWNDKYPHLKFDLSDDMWHTSLRDFLTFFIITSWFSVMNFEFLSKRWAYDEIGSVHRCLSSSQKFYNENNNNKRCFAMVKAAELQLLLLGVRTNAADWSASHDKHVQFYGLSVKISVQSLFPVSACSMLLLP